MKDPETLRCLPPPLSRHKQGMLMGQIYADISLFNAWTKKRVSVRALVDTGTTDLCITPDVARELGFDLDEATQRPVTLADGREVTVPRALGVRVYFQDRDHGSDALVMGNECLLGAIPLEGMDLIIDPKNQKLLGRHPDVPRSKAVGVRVRPEG